MLFQKVLTLILGLVSLQQTWLVFISLFSLPNSEVGVVDAQGMFFACTVSYCTAYGKCPEFSCRGKNKIVLRNVTECGCCHRCIEEKGSDFKL